MRCPCDILGVAKNATPAEIKKAYRKAILSAHPDKGGSVERFRAVQNAYEQLRDPEDMEPDEPDIIAMLAKVCRDLWVKRQKKALQVRLELDVTLAEVYSATVKKLQYRVKCNGASEVRSLLVPLADFKREAVFPGMGDCEGGKQGDLLLTIRVVPPSGAGHNVPACRADFQIDDVMGLLDLYTEVPVGLDTYLLGGHVAIPLPDGTHVQHTALPLLGKENNGKKAVTLHGRGLPSSRGDRGDLIVTLFLDIEGVDTAALSGSQALQDALATILARPDCQGGKQPDLQGGTEHDGPQRACDEIGCSAAATVH